LERRQSRRRKTVGLNFPLRERRSSLQIPLIRRSQSGVSRPPVLLTPLSSSKSVSH
jgi:hypothetical protein